MNSYIIKPENEALHRKRWGIKRNSAIANPPSLFELRRVHLAIHPCGKPQGILAKANRTRLCLLIIMAVCALMIEYLPGFKTIVYADVPGQKDTGDKEKEKVSALKEQISDKNKIVVKINGKTVTAQELMKRYNTYSIMSVFAKDNKQRITLDSYIDYYITKELLLEEANKMGIRVSRDEVEEEKKAHLIRTGLSEDTLSKNLIKAGLTMVDAERYLEDYLIMRRLGDKRLGDITISDEECREFYSDNYKYFNHPEKITASHILICHRERRGCSSNRTKKEAEKFAEDIRKIVTPDNFSRLAKQYSSDSTGESGGDLGDIYRGAAAPSFDKAAFNLDKGEISDVVETEYGYHIIYVTDKQEARAITFEDAKESIKKNIMEERITTELFNYSTQLLDKADIERYAVDGIESVKTIPSGSKFQTFKDTGEDICTNDKGQPIILLFSVSSCAHCNWVGDTFDDTVKEYVEMGLIEAHHYDIDTNDDLLTPDIETEIPKEYLKIDEQSEGYVPYFNFGCRYDRVGVGHAYEAQDDLFGEEIEMRKVIDALLK